MKSTKKLEFKDYSTSIMLALCLCFLLWIYAPLELFLNNQTDFSFRLGDMLNVVMPCFAVSMAVICAISALLLKLSRKLYYIVMAALFAVIIAFYVQGNFLVNNLPPLDGTYIDFNAYPAERIKSIAVWGGAALAVFAFCKILGTGKAVKYAGYVSLGVFGMLLITLSTLLLTLNLHEKNDLVFTEKDKYVMSSEKNFIIFSLDATSSEIFRRVLEDYPEYKEDFKDFTFYDNTLSAYPFTSRSIPFMLTGVWYENKEPFNEYQNRSFGESPLLNRLWDEDYSVGVYAPEYMVSYEQFEGKTINGVKGNGGVTSFRLMAKMMVKMTGLKYAPWDVKYLSYSLPEDDKYLQKLNSADLGFAYDYSTSELYSQLRGENPVAVKDGKCFKFIHFEGSHVPFDYDNDMNILPEGTGTYEDKAASAVKLTSMYLRMLKESGVYDNSVIIIASDHGYTGENYPYNYRVNPILFIKGIGEQHDEMRTDSAPISFVDLQEAYQRLLDGKDSSQVFDWKEGDRRDRRALMYYYLAEDEMEEYMVTGRADDADSMYGTGVSYIYGK